MNPARISNYNLLNLVILKKLSKMRDLPQSTINILDEIRCIDNVEGGKLCTSFIKIKNDIKNKEKLIGIFSTENDEGKEKEDDLRIFLNKFDIFQSIEPGLTHHKTIEVGIEVHINHHQFQQYLAEGYKRKIENNHEMVIHQDIMGVLSRFIAIYYHYKLWIDYKCELRLD